MGHRRPLRLALGLGVVTAALGAGIVLAGPSASVTGSSDVVRGRVDASGAPSGAEGWRAVRTATGEYRVDFVGEDVHLEIDRWDAVADATVIPMGEGTDVVRFTTGTGPVDTGFSFTALVDR